MQNISKEKLVKIIKSRQWMIQGFNGLPLYLHTVASNTGWMVKPIAGVNYSHFFLRMRENRAKYYYDEQDLAAIGYGYYKKIKNTGQLNKFVAQHKKDYLKAKRYVGKIPKRLNQLSLRELINLAQKSTRELSMAIGVTHCIEGISFVSEIKLKDILNKRGLNSHENFQLLSAPVKLSFLSQAQIALWKIKHAKKNEQQALINNFSRNFGWIDNSYVKAKILSADDVLKKAAAQKHLPSQSQLEKTKADKIKQTKILGLTKEEQFALKTVEICTSWQDDRKKFLMQTIGWLEPMVEELALRAKMPVENFKYIYARELTYKNLTGAKFLKQLAERFPKSDSYAIKNKIFTFFGSDSAFIEKQLKKSVNGKITELKGTVANKGIAKGRIRICRSIHDIPKLKKGEILVASMTRPEYLPAMQKAAAIVTDEGGITSHAAIISREMNKPCIIGTKIATEVFKDGDMVEVNANHGVVRRLK
jgi:phosphoenolpyruvate synthase/pyruvate phosphate dikinase